MTRQRWVIALLAAFGVAFPAFCLLMATWHARTLDYGERWGSTGLIGFFATAFVALILVGAGEL